MVAISNGLAPEMAIDLSNRYHGEIAIQKVTAPRQLQPHVATPTAPGALQVLVALGRHRAGQANGGGGRIDALFG